MSSRGHTGLAIAVVDHGCRPDAFSAVTQTLRILLCCCCDCRNPGKESPIHDHPCNNGCYVKVASGEVQEHRYARDEARNKLVLTGVSTANVGDVLYIDDGLGYHKVGNPSADVPARTLHLYSPPFTRCSVWLSERDALDKVS